MLHTGPALVILDILRANQRMKDFYFSFSVCNYVFQKIHINLVQKKNSLTFKGTSDIWVETPIFPTTETFLPMVPLWQFHYKQFSDLKPKHFLLVCLNLSNCQSTLHSDSKVPSNQTVLHLYSFCCWEQHSKEIDIYSLSFQEHK